MVMSNARDGLDVYIDAVAAALGLTVDPTWKPALRANLEVTLKFARLVEEFGLVEGAESAEIYET
jgi:hypothetical protein